MDTVTSDIAHELQERRMEDLPLLDYFREYAQENRRQQHEAAAAPKDLPEPHRYKEGDLVWLFDATATNTFETKNKVLTRWEGPVQIRDVLLGGAYTVQDLDERILFEGRSVHHICFKPYRDGKAWDDLGECGLGPTVNGHGGVSDTLLGNMLDFVATWDEEWAASFEKGGDGE